MQAGRFGDGLLILREEAAAQEPVQALPDAIWDNRFRLASHSLPKGAMIGKLGADAARFRGIADLPSAVLRTLPAVRLGNSVLAVPHLGYAVSDDHARIAILFTPLRPLAGPCFVPSGSGRGRTDWTPGRCYRR